MASRGQSCRTTWVGDFDPDLVFNCQWKGGSLSPCDAPARAAEFVSLLLAPGKQVCLRQALAFEPPTAEVAYAVDLAGKCWAGR
jgi:hypothetical protein